MERIYFRRVRLSRALINLTIGIRCLFRNKWLWVPIRLRIWRLTEAINKLTEQMFPESISVYQTHNKVI